MDERGVERGLNGASTSDEELMAVLEELLRHVRTAATAGGLSGSAASALSRVCREGPQRITELARAERATQPGMTQLVARMERDGLMRRKASPEDRRGVVVTATEAGRKVHRARREERTADLHRLLGRLTPREREAVRLGLPALARALAETAATS